MIRFLINLHDSYDYGTNRDLLSASFAIKKIISALPPKWATFSFSVAFFIYKFSVLICIRSTKDVRNSIWFRNRYMKSIQTIGTTDFEMSMWIHRFNRSTKTMISKSVYKVESIYALNMCTIFWVQYWSFLHHEPSNDFDFEMNYIERYYIDRRKLTFFLNWRQRVIKSYNFLHWIQFRTKYPVTS